MKRLTDNPFKVGDEIALCKREIRSGEYSVLRVNKVQRATKSLIIFEVPGGQIDRRRSSLHLRIATEEDKRIVQGRQQEQMRRVEAQQAESVKRESLERLFIIPYPSVTTENSDGYNLTFYNLTEDDIRRFAVMLKPTRLT